MIWASQTNTKDTHSQNDRVQDHTSGSLDQTPSDMSNTSLGNEQPHRPVSEVKHGGSHLNNMLNVGRVSGTSVDATQMTSACAGSIPSDPGQPAMCN